MFLSSRIPQPMHQSGEDTLDGRKNTNIFERWRNCQSSSLQIPHGEKRKLHDHKNEWSYKLCRRDLYYELIIVGVPTTATENDLQEHFGQFGSITYCKIDFDPFTKQSQGTACVAYASPAE